MALKVVLALAVVALAAADDGYDYNTPVRSFSHRNPFRAVSESSEEDDGYKYQQPARTFTHRAPVSESSEEDDGYKYQEPARTFTHRAPVRIAAKPKKVYVAPKPKNTYVAPKPVAQYVAPVRAVVPASSEEDGYDYQQPARTFTHRAPVRVAAPVRAAPASSEEDGYDYQQPAKTFTHRAPVRVAAPRPKNTYVAPAKPKNTYVAPKNTYVAPRSDSDEVLDYEPTNPEYNQRYAVADEETGAEFHHEEERDGAQTRGSYSVNLPDGRVQTVTYYVNGEGGFVAEVTYEGEAEYPPEPEGGYGPWTGATAAPTVVRGEYSAPRRTVVAAESSEEIQTPRGLYNAPRA